MNDDSADSRPAAQATVVQLQEVSLQVGGKVLLRSGSATFPAGQVSLIVGPSGAGKSLLLRAIAGLLQHDQGEVELDGEIRFTSPLGKPRQASVGVVFQSFALFDELSPLQNVRFAAAHGGAKRGTQPVELLRELGVPAHTRTSALSGGQRQRLAIARTLAYDPDVILYDEPTSGLDSASASQVARLIEQTHAQHPQTSVVVTHDVQALAPIADKIFLIDPVSQSLSEVPRDRWPQLEQRFQPLTNPEPLAAERVAQSSDLPNQPQRTQAAAVPTRPSWGSWTMARLGAVMEGTSRVFEAAVTLPWFLIPRFRSWPWGLRMSAHLLRLVAGLSAWLYLAVAGAIAGYVATYFTFRFLPFRTYTEPLLIENLLSALGFALYRILVPILVTVLIAARCGAAVTADISGKVYGQQFDALRTLGVKPARYLLTGTLYSFLIATPLLTVWAFVVARWVSLVVFTATHAGRGPDFWQLHFHQRFASEGWLPLGFEWLLAKTLCCAAGIAAVSYYQAAKPKFSPNHVSGAVTSAILWATLWVLATHFVFAFIEFD